MAAKKPTVGPKGDTGVPPKVEGMFDMERRLSEIEKKVQFIYDTSVKLDVWLKAQQSKKGT